MSVLNRPDPGDASQPLDGGPTADLLRAWQGGQGPELEAYVASLPNLSPCELADLVRVDLDQRQRRHDPRRAEDYLAHFPALAADAELAIDVIYAEYLAREQAGERPDAGEYQRRFPAFGDVLAEQIGLHCALAAATDDTLAEPTQTEPTVCSLVESPAISPQLEASYEILEEIGRGGMGVVYKARQPSLNRFVALKMVRAVDASNQELLALFRSEARVVASLRHPRIVQVYDFGEHDGLPYLAMELIECGTLANRLDGTPWPPRAAAELMIKLAAAVQYAHERHIIHRDLKPANVLIASDAEGLDVKITDFGLAKLFHDEGTAHTKSVAFLGTPSYMAPEQASGRARDVGPATDVYALGAILYELLTGRPPFRGASPMETLRQMLAAEPVSLNRLAPGVPRDLATICEKCLRTEINRRYASAAELRADLERYLAGVPVYARRISGAERTWRWCRCNPSWAVALGSAATLLVSIAAVSLWYSGRLSRELVKTQKAEQSERIANQSAQQRLFEAYMAEVTARNNSRRVGQRFAALDTIDKAATLVDTLGRKEDRALQLRNAVLCSVALPDMRVTRALGTLPENGAQCYLSIAADRYVIATVGGTLLGYRLADGRHLWTAEHSAAGVKPVLSRDGRFVAATSDEGTKVWRVDAPRPQLAWETARAQYFTFAPDGEHAAYSHPTEGMRLVALETGNIVRAIGKGSAHSPFAFDAARRRIAVCGADSAQVISWQTGEIERELPVGIGNGVQQCLAWHPRGEHLAVWSDAREIALWHVESQTKAIVLPVFGIPSQLCFNDDGSILASHTLWDQRLLVWDVGTGQRLLDVSGFTSRACDAASAGRIAFLGDAENTITMTELAPGACRALAQVLHTPLGFWLSCSISPEGRILALCSGGGLELWDLRTTHRLAVWPVGDCRAHFDAAGRLVVACSAGVYRWPRHVQNAPVPAAEVAGASSPGRTIVRLGPPERLVGPVVPTSLSISASGESLVFEDASGWAVMLPGNSTMVRLQTRLDPRNSAVSPDDRYAAIANWNHKGTSIWDAASGAHLVDLAVGLYGVVQFSPDGRLLAAVPDGVTVWRTSDWQRVGELHAHGTSPTGLGIAFSPDSRVLAVGQPNGILRLVDPVTGNDWAHLSHADLNVRAIMAFSPDQRYLITSSMDNRSLAQVWDLRVMRSELVRRGLDWPGEVLTASASSSSVEGGLEVVFDDGGLIQSLDAATRRSAAIRLWQDWTKLLRRAAPAATEPKATE